MTPALNGSAEHADKPSSDSATTEPSYANIAAESNGGAPTSPTTNGTASSGGVAGAVVKNGNDNCARIFDDGGIGGGFTRSSGTAGRQFQNIPTGRWSGVFVRARRCCIYFARVSQFLQ